MNSSLTLRFLSYLVFIGADFQDWHSQQLHSLTQSRSVQDLIGFQVIK